MQTLLAADLRLVRADNRDAEAELATTARKADRRPLYWPISPVRDRAKIIKGRCAWNCLLGSEAHVAGIARRGMFQISLNQEVAST